MKKIILLLVVALLPVFGFGQALNGDYVIGTSQSAPFNNLTNAINRINTFGVTGPVRFLIDNDQVTATPYTISTYTGTSAVNTLTIQPNVGKVVTITANNPNGWTVVRNVFRLNGAKNIIFNGSNNSTVSKDLTVKNGCTIFDGSDRTVFWLVNEANNITLKNMTIAQGSENADSSFSSGVFSGSSSVPKGVGTSSSSNLTISNNGFSGVKQGIYVDDTNVTNVTVTGNKFGTGLSAKTQNTIYLSGVTTFQVYKNEMKGINSTFSNAPYRAIYVNGSKGTIEKNVIYNIKRNNASQAISGIWLKSNVNNNPVEVTVSNNFITDVQTPGSHNNWNGGAYGLYIESGNGYKIYHNSINLKQQTQTTGLSSAFLVDNATNLDVRNNIFNNKLSYTGGGKASVIIITNNSSVFAHLDYNNYYSPVIGITQNINSGNYPITSLAAWKTALGKDTNSTKVEPVFVNENNDLHLVPEATVNVQYLGGVAVSQTGITHDIDEDIRYKTRPTMGADEIDETHCGGQVTWLNGVWSNGESVNWQGNETVKIIIASPYTLGDAKLLKSCQLEILPYAELTIDENATYIVEDKLTLNANSKMTVKDKGSFVQVNEPDINRVDPQSTFIVERKSQPMFKLDYTYWASPIKEEWNYKLITLSPTTLASKFYRWNETIQNWQINAPDQEVMKKGRGYIVREIGRASW